MISGRFITGCFIALLFGFIFVQPSQAVDYQEMNGLPYTEATDFFRDLIHTSDNPIIVSLAKENLQRLESPFKEQLKSKKITEVGLLPQYDSTYVVPAIINNKYVATFLVDTGASYTVITPKMIRFMGLSIPNNVEKIAVNTANGIVYAPIITLKKLTLGGMTVENVDVVVTELGNEIQISGLLGMSYFKGMDLSFQQNKLVLSR